MHDRSGEHQEVHVPSQGKGRLILVCGLPGSGKTTLARSLEQALAGVRMCPDDWMDLLGINLHDEAARARVEALQWALSRRLLEVGGVVIIEWGTWARSERDALRIEARALGAAVELRYLSASPEVLRERIRLRAMEDPPISDETIQRWFTVFEAPTSAEFALYDGGCDGAT